jgi:hypothetical protein
MDLKPLLRRELRQHFHYQLLTIVPGFIGFVVASGALGQEMNAQKSSADSYAVSILFAAFLGYGATALLWTRLSRTYDGERRQAIWLTIQCFKHVRANRDALLTLPPHRPAPMIATTHRTGHDRLPLLAWQLRGHLLVLGGYRRRDRGQDHAANVGKWLCFTGDDLHDRRRLEAGLAVCADILVHLLSRRYWMPPSLPWPPRSAQIHHPRRRETVRRSVVSLRTGLLVLIPLVSAILGLATRIT